MLQSPVLVLNATYEPVNVCAARRAIILILNGAARAEEENSGIVRSPRLEMRFVPTYADVLHGDRVVTSGGIFGAITKLNEQSVQLQIAQNVKVDLARNAIVGYQGQAPVVEAPNS